MPSLAQQLTQSCGTLNQKSQILRLGLIMFNPKVTTPENSG